jgi:hypothetical protein
MVTPWPVALSTASFRVQYRIKHGSTPLSTASNLAGSSASLPLPQAHYMAISSFLRVREGIHAMDSSLMDEMFMSRTSSRGGGVLCAGFSGGRLWILVPLDLGGEWDLASGCLRLPASTPSVEVWCGFLN